MELAGVKSLDGTSWSSWQQIQWRSQAPFHSSVAADVQEAASVILTWPASRPVKPDLQEGANKPGNDGMMQEEPGPAGANEAGSLSQHAERRVNDRMELAVVMSNVRFKLFTNLMLQNTHHAPPDTPHLSQK